MVILLSVGIRSFHRIVIKAFKDPLMGDGGMAWFIPVEIVAAPWVSNVPSPSVPLWKKPNGALSKAETIARVQSFCSTSKYESSPASSWLNVCF